MSKKDPMYAFLRKLSDNKDYTPIGPEEYRAAIEAIAEKRVRTHGNKFIITNLGRYYVEEREGKAEGLTMIRALKPTRNRIKTLQAQANSGAAERVQLEHILEQMTELYDVELWRQMNAISKELRTPVSELSRSLARYLSPENLKGPKRDRVLAEMFGQT